MEINILGISQIHYFKILQKTRATTENETWHHNGLYKKNVGELQLPHLPQKQKTKQKA